MNSSIILVLLITIVSISNYLFVYTHYLLNVLFYSLIIGNTIHFINNYQS